MNSFCYTHYNDTKGVLCNSFFFQIQNKYFEECTLHSSSNSISLRWSIKKSKSLQSSLIEAAACMPCILHTYIHVHMYKYVCVWMYVSACLWGYNLFMYCLLLLKINEFCGCCPKWVAVISELLFDFATDERCMYAHAHLYRLCAVFICYYRMYASISLYQIDIIGV